MELFSVNPMPAATTVFSTTSPPTASMPTLPARTRRSQLACPRCGTHKVSVRDTVAKGHRIIERYRICEACRHLFKTREQIVSDYRESEKATSDKALS